ncbi:sensor histidine kinase [Promicromonospora citrea]|uniref:histidine kinase n=1 Tax=Promicromonospora citrea TaxID=43677 RepID=A0A8H9GLB7_9MICO|nr:HAMP domain-containing sensor histidine kinase [Promicromonospora citrea]GGM29095.1 sensor protein CutS [Promicromonospora citrea]
MTLRLPGWAATVRMRLAVTYSATLFGVTALILAGVYLALSSTVVAAPLDPVTVKRFEKKPDGSIAYKPGEQFQAADLDTVQHAVNYAALQTLRDYSAVALAVMFLLSVVIGWWVAGRALRPVEAITRTAQEIGATDLSRRIGATGPHDELRTLADTIDGMLDRLDRAFSAERRLIEDVSHELRNPVMVVQANVEAVLADDQADRAQRAEAAAVVLAATARMSRLLEDLLATARLRSEAFADQEVDLAALVSGVVRENRAVARQRGVALAERAHPGPVAYGDANALARAVGNLLSNAVRLAPSGSTVTVGVGSRQGWAWVAVADEGPGVPDEERDRIFDRFYRGTNGAGTDGSGLGLAIARQVAESHDGHLRHTAHDAGERGSTFTIWLPDRTLDRAAGRDAVPPGGDPLTT